MLSRHLSANHDWTTTRVRHANLYDFQFTRQSSSVDKRTMETKQILNRMYSSLCRTDLNTFFLTQKSQYCPQL